MYDIYYHHSTYITYSLHCTCAKRTRTLFWFSIHTLQSLHMYAVSYTYDIHYNLFIHITVSLHCTCATEDVVLCMADIPQSLYMYAVTVHIWHMLHTPQSLFIYGMHYMYDIHHSLFSYMTYDICMTYTTQSHFIYMTHATCMTYTIRALHILRTLCIAYITLCIAYITLCIAYTATHCNTLQHTATHCNTLQHTTTHCNTLHCIYYIYYSLFALNLRQEKEEVVALVGQTIRQLRHYWNGPLCQYCRRVAVSVSELQCVAVRCSVLQCVAVCCSVLQCVVQRDLNGPQWVEV